MNLHHLTDRCLRPVRVDPVLPGSDESFADPPGSVANLRGRASVIRIGRAVLAGEQAYSRFNAARSGTLAESRAVSDVFDELHKVVQGAEAAVMVGDPFQVGRRFIDTLGPWTRVALFGRFLPLEEFRSGSHRLPFRGRRGQDMRALVDGLFAVPDVEPVDGEMLDVHELLAEMLER